MQLLPGHCGLGGQGLGVWVQGEVVLDGRLAKVSGSWLLCSLNCGFAILFSMGVYRIEPLEAPLQAAAPFRQHWHTYMGSDVMFRC